MTLSTLSDIARMIDYSHTGLTSHIRKAGIKPVQGKFYSMEEVFHSLAAIHEVKDV